MLNPACGVGTVTLRQDTSAICLYLLPEIAAHTHCKSNPIGCLRSLRISCRKGWILYWAPKGHNASAVVQEAAWKKQKVDTSVPLKTSFSGSGEKRIDAAQMLVAESAIGEPPPSKDTVVPAGEIGSRVSDFAVEDLQARKISSNEIHSKSHDR